MRKRIASTAGVRRLLAGLGLGLFSFLMASPAYAEDSLSAGDTAWMLTSTALVLLMTLPGLALFYGGLVRSKNVLSILMQCLISAGLMGVLWIVIGYSLAFSGDGAFIGDTGKALLAGITPETLSGTIPEYVFIMFQGMFAIITPALMIGAFAERMRFGPYLAFITIWVLVVYCPLAHMVWGGGMLSGWGALDFAGGLVVHMSSGFSALALAMFLGPRAGYGKKPLPPHNLPLVVIGASLLWVGWFGFNAGSALAADGTAGLAFLTTSTATSMAVITWVAIEWLHQGKPTVLGAATAAVAGLVSITPACAFVSPVGALAVGFGGASICYVFVTIIKPNAGYDDSLDVFGVHGIGGAWGALATGLFLAEFAMPEGGTRMSQTLIQLKSIGFTAIFAPAATLVILFGLRAVLGSLRPDDESEAIGLDQTEHNESAYIETT
ncbi:MAG: ammonium transporter [Deltaproteobacteria bacterium]|nr:ammonium transporter [Deltaproteobacteria bacterium]MBW2360775.1 ammonium transporter [Deltaproteobacteria bacterium]